MVNFYKLNLIIESQEEESVLIPRRSKQERERNYALAIQRQIQQYIKQGSVGDLDLNNTPITSLPDNLKVVNGHLDLSNTPITSLPDNLKVVNGYLDLGNTLITSLPDNLKVNGDLVLINTSITSLPDNLTVYGNLFLNHTPITSLPNNLKVSRDLLIYYTPIIKKYSTQQLKDMLPGVKGDIYGY